MIKVAVLDDYQNVFEQVIDLSLYKKKYDFTIFNEPFMSEEEAAIALEDFEAIFIMRERTPITKYLINSLQNENKLELSEVTSPTFNLLNEYQINEVKINHYDLFRLKSPIELENLDIFSDIKNVITLIEWPQIIEKKPKNLIELTFEYKDDHKRRSVQIKGLEL